MPHTKRNRIEQARHFSQRPLTAEEQIAAAALILTLRHQATEFETAYQVFQLLQVSDVANIRHIPFAFKVYRYLRGVQALRSRANALNFTDELASHQ